MGAENRSVITKPSCLFLFAIASSLLGAVSVGLMVGYTSSAIPSMEKDNSETDAELIASFDEEIRSWIKSITTVGAMIGAFASGPIANIIGRKLTLIVTNLPFLIGWLLIGLCSSPFTILLGRIIHGICAGFLCTAIPVYLAEISPTSIRGLVGATFQAAIVVGILVSSIIGAIFEWRSLAFISSIPSIIMPVCMYFVPDTPLFLFSKHGTPKSALAVLKKLRSNSSDVDSEFSELGDKPPEPAKLCLPLSDFTQANIYKPFIITVGIMFFQQASGITPVLYSMVEIFELSQISLNSNICSIIVNSVQVISTIISSMFFDRCGRKPLLILSGLVHAISLGALGLCFYLVKQDASFGERYGWITVIALTGLVVGFSLGFGPISWSIVPEYTAFPARGLVSSTATFCAWSFAFILTKTFDDLQDILGPHGLYWSLGSLSALGMIFVAFFVPETKGKTIDQLTGMFNTKSVYDVPFIR